MISRRLRIAQVYSLFFLSGCAGLGYQLIWTREFSTGLGHELPAVLAVVAAFFGGVAIGSRLLDRRASTASNPGRFYAWAELVIGGWGIISLQIIPMANHLAQTSAGFEKFSEIAHWLISFGAPFLSLLPATVAMGATLPAMERFAASLTTSERCFGAVYAVNTAGAVVGVFATMFLLLPNVGLRSATVVMACLNLFCAIGAFILGKPSPSSATTAVPKPKRETIDRHLIALLFFTGVLGVGFEVAGVRLLSQVLENSVYTFAAVLAVYLLGTAVGGALYQKYLRQQSVALLTEKLLLALSAAVFFEILILSRSRAIYETLRASWPDSWIAASGVEGMLAGAIFGLPTVLMGALFSHLIQASKKESCGIGTGAAWNTLGGALAPALFGVALFPKLGGKWTMISLGLGYLGCGLLSRWQPRMEFSQNAPQRSSSSGASGLDSAKNKRHTLWIVWIAPAFIFLLLALRVDLRLIAIPPSSNLVSYRPGVMASVAVIGDKLGQRTLRVNNHFQMGGTAALIPQRRQTHIPLLLREKPKCVLFLGVGTGITLGATDFYPQVQADGVELIPEIIEALPEFAPENRSPQTVPRVRLRRADARRFVRTSSDNYDVIVADLFHPGRDGAGALYTTEHFRAIQERLTPGGLFCQWLPLYQLDEETLRVITKTFLTVFPEAKACLLHFNIETPVLGLIASSAPLSAGSNWQQPTPSLAADLRASGLRDWVHLFGTMVADGRMLAEFCASAQPSTDDRSVVTFAAPRFLYRKQISPYARLQTVLKLAAGRELDLAREFVSPENAGRLANFMGARNFYLSGLIEEAEGREEQAVASYIESARASNDFTLGYSQCILLATSWAKTKPAVARALLERLIQAQPNQPLARDLLKRL